MENLKNSEMLQDEIQYSPPDQRGRSDQRAVNLAGIARRDAAEDDSPPLLPGDQAEAFRLSQKKRSNVVGELMQEAAGEVKESC